MMFSTLLGINGLFLLGLLCFVVNNEVAGEKVSLLSIINNDLLVAVSQ